MNDEAILTELLALRARLDDLIGQIRTARPAPANTNALTYMKIDEFAKRWQTSRSTIYTRIGQGLPVIGEGHDRRIKVDAGDEWMSKRTKRGVG